MDRRFFLRASAAAIGALALDPERALWIPGRKAFCDLGAGAMPADIGFGTVFINTLPGFKYRGPMSFVPGEWQTERITLSQTVIAAYWDR